MNVRRSLDPTPAPSLRNAVINDEEDILFSGSLMQYTMLVSYAVGNYESVEIKHNLTRQKCFRAISNTFTFHDFLVIEHNSYLFPGKDLPVMSNS